MILKHRKFPKDIEQLQTIEKRLLDHHPELPNVKEQLKYRLSGYKGELALNFPLTFLPRHARIFHDLRLYDGTHFFQIDCLVLTDHYMVIIEAKNIGGELYYNQRFNYLRRKWTEGEQTFSDPVLQVRRHRRQLQQWLGLKHFPDVPIYCLVANSHPETAIDTDDSSLDIVIRTESLPEKMAEIHSSQVGPPIETTFLEHISTILLEGHTEQNYNYIERHSLGKSDFKGGVFCHKCQHLPMTRIYGTWKCPYCGYKYKQAHHSALRDYFFIYGAEITNKTARGFLLIDSAQVTQSILMNMNLRTVGNNKGRIYFLDY